MDYLEIRLQEAIRQSTAHGKESFDFPRFTELYLHDTGSCESLRPDAPSEVQDYYRRMYYVDYPEVMTVAAYASLLNQLDLQS